MTPTVAELSAKFESADVIIVSGGNTLHAIDRWVKLGVNNMARAAMERGAVLTGGSAGAICWFDAGHSDSDDSETFMAHMLKEAGAAVPGGPAKDESSGFDAAAVKSWK